MKKEVITDQIIERREKVDQIIHDNYHRLSKKFGLSLDQFHLLLELDELMIDLDSEFDAPTISTLAKNISVAQNTISERISRLEKKELVKRIMDREDRRINHVILTDMGRKLLHSISEEAETDFIKSALLKMQEDELSKFLSCYDKLLAQMMTNIE